MNYVIRPILTFSIIACIISPLFLFSCAGTSDAQKNEMAPMIAELKILDVSAKDSISVQIEFTLKNESASKLEVLKWGTPFEGEFTDNMFDVKIDGKQIRYIGMQIKRGSPQKEDFMEIGPHGALSVKLFLEEGYDIKEAGLYSVQYSKPYVSVKSNGNDMKLIPVHSNKINFTVAK